jgi:dihydrofolate reductase
VTKVVADISISLDGYVTGPHPGLEHGLGVGGEPLQEWAVQSDDDTDVTVLREAAEASGAVVMGRRLFDVVEGPPAGTTRWVTAPPTPVHRRAAAGEKDVFVMGGADVVRQCVVGGLADELRIHLAPIVLGGGTALFGPGDHCLPTQASVRVSSTATHLTYHVEPGTGG